MLELKSSLGGVAEALVPTPAEAPGVSPLRMAMRLCPSSDMDTADKRTISETVRISWVAREDPEGARQAEANVL